MRTGGKDAVILTDQFFGRVTTGLTKQFVDPDNSPLLIRDRNQSVFIQGGPQGIGLLEGLVVADDEGFG